MSPFGNFPTFATEMVRWLDYLRIVSGARRQQGDLEDALHAVEQDDTRALLQGPPAQEVAKLVKAAGVPRQSQPRHQRLLQRLSRPTF